MAIGREKQASIEGSKFGSAGFNSFSGTDIKVMISVPDGNGQNAIIKEMKNIQTFTYSVFREKGPVRSLGSIGEKGKARGIRTIAGSIVFTVFDMHPLLEVMRAGFGDRSKGPAAYTMADQLPPFDIILHFANEYGFTSELVLLGIEIMSEGQVQSVQDIITENTMQYTARDMMIMRPGGYLSAFDKVAEDLGRLVRGMEGMGGREAEDLSFMDYPGGAPAPPRTFNSIVNGTGGGPLNRLIERSHSPLNPRRPPQGPER